MNKVIKKIYIFIFLCLGVFYSLNKIESLKPISKGYYIEKNLMITLPTNTVKQMALGFDNVLADIIWVQFIQYYGENLRLKLNGSKEYDFSYTYKYIDVITTLDPNFSYAYWFGSFCIADEMNDPELAIALLNRGIQNNPDNWWLPYTASIMELMYFGNFYEAQKYVNIAYILNSKSQELDKLKKVLELKVEKREKEKLILVDLYNNARIKGDFYTADRVKAKLKALGYNINEG